MESYIHSGDRIYNVFNPVSELQMIFFLFSLCNNQFEG